MYPKFVEFHHLDDGSAFLANVTKVKYADNGYVGGYAVRESYDEIKTLIEDTGCLIHKGDPRLTTKPLTIEDMRDLIGEPIWNSNNDNWYLIAQYSDTDHAVRVMNVDGWSLWLDADALLKFPHYRMKREVSHD